MLLLYTLLYLVVISYSLSIIIRSLSIIASQSLPIIIFLKSIYSSITQNLLIIVFYITNVINNYKPNKTLILFSTNYEK